MGSPGELRIAGEHLLELGQIGPNSALSGQVDYLPPAHTTSRRRRRATEVAYQRVPRAGIPSALSLAAMARIERLSRRRSRTVAIVACSVSNGTWPALSQTVRGGLTARCDRFAPPDQKAGVIMARSVIVPASELRWSYAPARPAQAVPVNRSKTRAGRSGRAAEGSGLENRQG